MTRLFSSLLFLMVLLACSPNQKPAKKESAPHPARPASRVQSDPLEKQDGATESPNEVPAPAWNYPFLRRAAPPVREFRYPMTVQELVDRHGTPDSTRIHRDAFCPLGQFHYWSLPEKNLQFIALGTQAGKPVNYSAPAEVLILRPLHPDRPVDFNGPFDLHLGDEEAEVKAGIQSFLKEQDAFSSATYTAPTVVDHFLGEPVQEVHWLTDEQLFLHFAMRPDSRLGYVVLAVFNLRAVC